MKVSDAIKSRKSVRQFTSQPVSEIQVRELLDISKWAPSGGNLQPWKIQALTGAPLKSLVDDVAEKLRTGVEEAPEYNVYPPELTEPYRTRRRVVGQALYDLIGVPRSDTPGKMRQLAKNFEFFGAPIGIFFILDRQMEIGQFADLGMLMQNIMLLAREMGLHTCPQEAWARWPETVSRHLEVPENEMMFCGMALGYVDDDAVINQLQSERDDFDQLITMRGF
ncbi:MAG: nitroreductase [Sneathiella sp.]